MNKSNALTIISKNDSHRAVKSHSNHFIWYETQFQYWINNFYLCNITLLGVACLHILICNLCKLYLIQNNAI